MLPLLKHLASGESFQLKDIMDDLSKEFNLSEEERQQLLPSKGQRVFDNRVAWAKSYLKQAGLIEYPKHGLMKITDEGRSLVESGIENIDKAFLKQYPMFQDFQSRKKNNKNQSISINEIDIELFQEFAEIADEWFSKNSFVVDYWKFINGFFDPENLEKIEWEGIQALGNHIHSLSTNSLAKTRAFGNPNYTIQQYRDSFLELAHGKGTVEERMRWFLTDDSATSKFLGPSSVGEILGQLHGDQYVFYNRRDEEAARYLGINPGFERGDDEARRFEKFSRTVREEIFPIYIANVGKRTEAPVGLEVDQFFSWIYETKKLNEKPVQTYEKPEHNTWELLPGPNGSYWELFYREGIAAIGWNELGNLKQYKSREEISEAIKRIYHPKNEPRNDSLALWQWLMEVKPGDTIIGKKGRKTLVGRGVVEGDYEYHPERPDYHHVRHVKWEKAGIWKLPEDLNLAPKSLTNLTPYPDHVAKLMGVIDETGIPQTAKQYWWMNCNPAKWNVVNLPIGHKDKMESYNEDGTKKRKSENFDAIKPGDEILAYVSYPDKKITSLLKVIGQIEEDRSFEFEIIEHFSEQPQWEALKRIDQLSNCEPLINNQGTLFSLTDDEFIVIKELTEGILPTEETPSSNDENPYSIEDEIDDVFMEGAEFKRIVDLFREKKNIILQGPPGVGKTFIARKIAFALMEQRDETRVHMIQFHQSYSYEDFVQGIRPSLEGGFKRKNGVFFEFCEKARKDDRPWVFIIDEINRGNLSKILGELMMLIEHNKRLKKYEISLVYQEDGEPRFYVPENVYILGLMNTADRSLALVDYALRRRFAFVDVPPAFTNGKFKKELSKLFDEALSEKIVDVFLNLNEDIKKNVDNLGPGFMIGHSYFCYDAKESFDRQRYKLIIETEIAPLLREYWFDHPQKAEDSINRLLSVVDDK